MVTEDSLIQKSEGTNPYKPEPIQQEYTNSCSKIQKIRIYEIAHELNMDSRMLIGKLQAKGYRYNNPLNTVDKITAKEIKEALIPNSAVNVLDIDTITQADKPEYFLGNSQITDAQKHSNGIREANPYLAVKSLADTGYSIKEIAQFLNRGQGEVSLLINLLNKKKLIYKNIN